MVPGLNLVRLHLGAGSGMSIYRAAHLFSRGDFVSQWPLCNTGVEICYRYQGALAPGALPRRQP